MVPRLCSLALLLAAGATAAGQQARYPRPGLLIEPAELAGSDIAKKGHILDTRSKDEFQAGHIPGAVPVDAAAWAKAFNNDTDTKSWIKRIGSLGIARADRPVVVYSDDVREAARVWWILRYWGLTDVRLLNGGWQGWQAAGGKVQTGVRQPPRALGLKLTPHPDRLETRAELLRDLKRAGVLIIDTRSEAEFCGDKKLARRGGAIPGAKHLEWSDLINPKTKRFKSPAALAKLFKEAGIDPKRPSVTYCQSGGRASVMAFALELMGGQEVRNYYRSWNEWGNADDTPVTTPKKKKKK
jgi:thiosulfate/3-mercaptopyruvate sulfurtransferase